MSTEYALCKVIEDNQEKFRAKFEPLIVATGNLAEVRVLAGTTLRLTRLTSATKLLAQSGFKEETNVLLRGALESIVNLLYIMHVGPTIENKTQNQLADQFLSYGQIAFQKFAKTLGPKARAHFKAEFGATDAQVDTYFADLEAARQSALIKGCKTSRWNSRFDLRAMATEVTKHFPPFLFSSIAEMIFENFVTLNSSTHGDSMSWEAQFAELQNRPLEVKKVEFTTNANIVAGTTYWAWEMVAVYYNQTEWFGGFLSKAMFEVVRENAEAAKKEAAKTVLVPPLIKSK